MMMWRVVSIILLFGGLAFGGQVDPFAEQDSLVEKDQPRALRVHMVTVGMGVDEYVEYMRTEKAGDFAYARELMKLGKAEMLDVNVVVGRSGERFTLESIREEIYPTEYEPPGSDLMPELQHLNDVLSWLRPHNFTAFETRNTGFTLEVEPVLVDDDTVELRLASEFVDPVGYAIWQEFEDRWGREDLKTPLYLTHRVNTGGTLPSGEFMLVTVYSGKDAEGNVDGRRKILVFVMCEILSIVPK